MDVYQVEHICLYCRLFNDCVSRSKDGSCIKWQPELCLNSLMEVLKLDDIVLNSKDPICCEYNEKAKNERDAILQYFQELRISRIEALSSETLK